MKIQKLFLIKFVIFLVIFLLISPGFSFEAKKLETISIQGIIESIDKDSKFIIVDGTKIFISSNTKVVDEIGNILLMYDLIPKLSVNIEGLQKPNGFFAQKIVVKKLKKSP